MADTASARPSASSVHWSCHRAAKVLIRHPHRPDFVEEPSRLRARIGTQQGGNEMNPQTPTAYYWGDRLELLKDKDAWNGIPLGARAVEMVMAVDDLLSLRKDLQPRGQSSWQMGNRLELLWKAR